MNDNRRRRIVGLDESGRGSIIGPLVIGAVAVDEEGLRKLIEIGVRDSKILSSAGRTRLFPMIKDIAKKVVIRKITPEEIDEYVSKGKKYKRLNYLEAINMGEVASELDPDIIYVDASDTDPDRFSRDIRSILNRDVEIISVHHADSIYPVVSAASIVAKCERDAEVVKIAKVHGFFGSGYPSDPRTTKFLTDWLSTHGKMPPFSRKSWKTWKKIGFKSLDEF